MPFFQLNKRKGTGKRFQGNFFINILLLSLFSLKLFLIIYFRGVWGKRSVPQMHGNKLK